MADSIIVISGGMDSAVLLADILDKGKKPDAISFNYGSKHNARELPMARELCKSFKVNHRIIRLPFINELFSSSLLESGADVPDGKYDQTGMASTLVPFRNGIMLSIAIGYAESVGSSEVLLASHTGDHFIYPDCRPEFNKAFSEAAFLGTDKKVRLSFPYTDMDKREIGDLGRKLGIDFTRTWTCYKGKKLHCGTCGSCTERKYALRHDQGMDTTVYEK